MIITMLKEPAWEKTLENIFKLLGFSDKEAKIYRIILDLGLGSAGEIIKKSGLKRGITYAILYNLEKQGLIRKFQKRSKTYFQTEDPQKLIDILENKKKQIDTLDSNLSQIVPQLRSHYKLALGKPTIRYFEGEEGIKTVFADIYAKKNDIVWGCVDLEKVDEAFPDYIQKQLIPLRIRNQVTAHSLVADSPQAREIAEKDKKQLRKTILVDKQEYPLPAEIDVYEDKIAMLSFRQGDFIGLILENKDIAESLRSVFKLAFARFGKSPSGKDTGAKSGKVKDI